MATETNLSWMREALATDAHVLRHARFNVGVTLEDLELLLFALGTFPTDAVHKVKAPNPAVDLAGQQAIDAYTAFADGHTLVFREAHRRLPPIALVAAELSHGLGLEVRANLYLTPAGSQGFTAHFDSHDVVVMQLHGEKRWSVFTHVGRRPLDAALLSAPQQLLRGPDPHFSTSDPETLTVVPGDLLTIPCGLPHQAVAANGSSLHCTFALLHPSRAEALALTTFAAATGDATLLEAWDPAVALAPVAAGAPEAEQVAYALALMRQRSRAALPGSYLRTLCELGTLDVTTPLERRPGVRPWIGAVDGRRQFVFGTQRFWVVPELEAAFAFFAECARFVPADVPIVGYDPLELCRDMVVRGLLQEVG